MIVLLSENRDGAKPGRLYDFHCLVEAGQFGPAMLVHVYLLSFIRLSGI